MAAGKNKASNGNKSIKTPRAPKTPRVKMMGGMGLATNAGTVEMNGGESYTSITLLVILILLSASILAFLLYNKFNNKNTDIPVEKIIIRKEIMNITESDPQPPIYPRRDPVYPLRNVPADYQQMGVLVSQDSAEYKKMILPLFGRKMLSKDRWEYYTASNDYNMWRISVRVNNRDCQDDVGCDEIFNGDNVTIPDMGDKVFVARIYKYRDYVR